MIVRQNVIERNCDKKYKLKLRNSHFRNGGFAVFYSITQFTFQNTPQTALPSFLLPL